MTRRDWCPCCGRLLYVNGLVAPADRYCGQPWSYLGEPRWASCNVTHVEEDAPPRDGGPAGRWRALALRWRWQLGRLLLPSWRRAHPDAEGEL